MSEGKVNKRVWLLASVLLICVMTTTIAVVNIFNSFRLDSSGAIDLVVDAISYDVVDESNETDKDQEVVVNNQKPKDDVSDDYYDDVDSNMYYQPGFEVSDDEGVWTTNTRVDIFSVYYVNGEQVVTVKSDDGDKLIAPGTEKSYSFKLKNTGNVALDYVLNVDAYVSNGDVTLPIESRLSRYDGKWIVGDGNSFVDIPTLDNASDKDTLAKERYTYYTLDWKWPFEGDDALDTLLGNMAVDEDIVFTIEFNTVAEISDDVGSGIIDTADSSSSTVWLIMSGVSFVLMIFLLFARRSDEDDESEAK